MIDLHALTIGRRRHPVARNLAASAPRGSLVVPVGRNGSGKTTLLHTLGALIPPLGGTIRCAGEDLMTCAPRRRATLVSLMLSERVHAEGLTVTDVLQTARLPHERRSGRTALDAAATHAAELCDIRPLLDRRLDSLSDGQAQWVMLARAIAQDTPVMLLDEPTAHLDPPGKRALFALLRHVAHDEGRTVIVATHDLAPACAEADRIWLLHEGRLFAGTPDDDALRARIAAVLETDI